MGSIIATTGETRDVLRISIGGITLRKEYGRASKLEGKIKMYILEASCEDVRWIELRAWFLRQAISWNDISMTSVSGWLVRSQISHKNCLGSH
jgi:hypothetical protein